MSPPNSTENKTSNVVTSTKASAVKVKQTGIGSKDLDLTNLLQSIQLSKRLLGEIAFQLDRRIVNYVFSAKHDKRQRKRLYGYCVQNIESYDTETCY